MALATKCYELAGVRVLECMPGLRLRNDRDAVEVIGATFENQTKWVVIPVECLDDDFFRLKTRIAGEIVQKFATYERRVAIVGDISRHLAESEALQAFVRESNRGRNLWFVASLEELGSRLAREV